jgi:hypothetical protein
MATKRTKGRSRRSHPAKKTKTKRPTKKPSGEPPFLIIRASAFLVREVGDIRLVAILDRQPDKNGQLQVAGTIGYRDPRRRSPRDPNPRAIIGSDLEAELDAFGDSTVDAPSDRQQGCHTQLVNQPGVVFSCTPRGCKGACELRKVPQGDGFHVWCECVKRNGGGFPDS